MKKLCQNSLFTLVNEEIKSTLMVKNKRRIKHCSIMNRNILNVYTYINMKFSGLNLLIFTEFNIENVKCICDKIYHLYTVDYVVLLVDFMKIMLISFTNIINMRKKKLSVTVYSKYFDNYFIYKYNSSSFWSLKLLLVSNILSNYELKF